MSWFDLEDLSRLALLRDYNTRVVVFGVGCLGLACGLIGSFLLLRKRALLSDAVSHATLPGIALAFMVMAKSGGDGKWLPGLLIGAAVFGALGMLSVQAISQLTRIKEDAALGIVLSVFFGLGIALLGVVQKLNAGNAAGLSTFIYGKTAAMLLSDAWLIAALTLLTAVVSLLLFKEFTLLCFDSAYARAQGWPTSLLDVALMSLIVLVTVVGLQAVGLILVVALLIIPPAAARFWTNHLPTMAAISAGLGVISGVVGAALSALYPGLPAGAVIVLAAGALFLVSLLFGPARGLLMRVFERRRLQQRMDRQHLLRAMYELSESAAPSRGLQVEPVAVSRAQLQAERSWSALRLERLLRRAKRSGWVIRAAQGDDAYQLTPAGLADAWQVARSHRLWELFLITQADTAASEVDQNADAVEHMLDPEMVAQLEEELASQHPDLAAPESPHDLTAAQRAADAAGAR